MIEVQYGDRSAILGSFLDFMTDPSMPTKTPKGQRSPRSLFSGWSSSSSESSESHDGDHHTEHQEEHQKEAQPQHENHQEAAQTQHDDHHSEDHNRAWKHAHDNDHHRPASRQSHNLEVDPLAAEYAAAPPPHNHAKFSKTERRKLQRIHTWAQDVEAQTMRRPLILDKDQPMPKYMTFDQRDRQWVFRQPYSDPGSEQSSSFHSMLARFGMRRSERSTQREPIGWWWPWVIVALLVIVLIAVAVYFVSQQPYRDGPDVA